MKSFTSIVILIAGLQYTLAQRTANEVRLELLENKLESLQSNVESLQSNEESLQSNVESLQSNMESLQSNMENHGQRIEDLENGLWFDAYRVRFLSANSDWTPITFDGVRTNTNVLDVYQLKSSGEFRAPIAGAYQFTLQVEKPYNRIATIRLRKNQDTVSYANSGASSSSDYRDSLSTTAMVELKVGDIVTAETYYTITSSSSQRIHFTCLLLSRN